MKEIIFNMLEELIELTTFELEFHHRMKSNLFSERWINCSRSRTRIKRMKNYLYISIKTILESHQKIEFFNIAVKPFILNNLNEILESIEISKKNGKAMDLLQEFIFYKLELNEIFIIFTNIVAWEHQIYPTLLEFKLFSSHHQNIKMNLTDDYLRYYIRFLDVLSSSEIISLFDLDALRHTIRSDEEYITQKSINTLHLFEDWPILNLESFSNRFPHFKENLSRKIVNYSIV